MNRVVHFEIHADDLDRAQKFYETVFGWKFQIMGPELGNYRVIKTGEDKAGEKWPGINGGMLKRNGPVPDATRKNPVVAYVCTISVDDIDETIANLKKTGAVEHAAKMDVPGIGKLAYYADTEGNIFGILQPVMSAK